MNTLKSWMTKGKKKTPVIEGPTSANVSTELDVSFPSPVPGTKYTNHHVDRRLSLQPNPQRGTTRTYSDQRKLSYEYAKGEGLDMNTSMPSLGVGTPVERRKVSAEANSLDMEMERFGKDTDKIETLRFISNMMVPYVRERETGPGDGEEEQTKGPGADMPWADKLENRGFIRVFHRDANRHTLISVDANMTTQHLCVEAAKKFKLTDEQALTHHLYVQIFTTSCTSPSIRRLEQDEQPLRLQQQWLMDMGYGEDDNLQVQGRSDIFHLFQFVYTDHAAKEHGIVHALDRYEWDILSVLPQHAVLDCANLSLGLHARTEEFQKMIQLRPWLSQVGHINVAANYLRGLNEIIQSVSGIVTLNASNNYLTSLPADFAKTCPHIQKLDLSRNRFSEIPVCLGAITSLVSVSFAYNGISEVAEDVFGESKGLRRLYLNNNQLKTVGEHIVRLTQLEVLDISENQLRNLPDLENMRLKTFKCHGNQIARVKIENMSDLEHVNLSNNLVSIFAPNLSVVVHLDLSRNNLSTLPDCLDRLPNVQVLTLDHNRLSQLPPSFSALTNIEVLSIKRNDLWSLPKMGHLVYLRELNVCINNLTHLPDDLFLLRCLRKVNASSNNIQRLPPVTERRPSAVAMNLLPPSNLGPPHSQSNNTSNTTITMPGTPELFPTPHRRSSANSAGSDVSVGSVRIEVEKDSEGGFSRERERPTSYSGGLAGTGSGFLGIVSLAEGGDNPGGVLNGEEEEEGEGEENELDPLAEIAELLRAGNPTENTATEQPGDGFVRLKRAASYKFKRGRPGSFTNRPVRTSKRMPSRNHRYRDQRGWKGEVDGVGSPITELYLGNNKLRDDSLRDSIGLMTNLRVLHLGGNALTELDYVSRLTRLEILALGGNLLSYISDDIGHLTALKELYLNDNKLCSLPQVLGRLTQLAVLDLSDNNISCRPSNGEWVWTYNTELQILDLSRNKRVGVTNLGSDFSTLQRLKVLNLEGVQLPCRCKDPGYGVGYTAGGPLFCSQCVKTNLPEHLQHVVRLGPYLHDVGLTEAKQSGSWLGLLPRSSAQHRSSATQISTGAPDEVPYYRKSITAPTISVQAAPADISRMLGPFADEFLTFREEVWSGSAFRVKRRTVGGSIDYEPQGYNIRHGNFSLHAQSKEGLSLLPCHQVFALFAGHNGREVSQYVSETFIRTFWEEVLKSYDNHDIDNNILRALRRTFLAINRGLVKDKPHLSRMSGSSGVVVCISRTRLFVANCGTALAVLCRNGKAVPLSSKHTAKDPSENQRILQRGGYVSEDGKVFGLVGTSRAFGLFFLQPYVHSGAYVGEHPLSQEDEFVILGCNGLWGAMSFQMAVDIVRTQHSPWQAAQRLREAAWTHGSREEDIHVQVIFTPKQLRSPRKLSIINAQPYLDSVAKPEEITPPHGKVTLVFTDIKNSTELWEKETNSMREAVRLHNELMRRLLRQHRGYEVKTEGDAFMVSFDSTTHALQWCLDVQLQLLELKWPRAILDMPEGKEVRNSKGDQVLFVGLRVRMGIHTGSPDCEPDPITGRMDYFGPMVNRSARVASLADGGQIVLSHHVWEEVYDTLGEDTVNGVLGAFKLKGLAEKEIVRQILPKSLEERIGYLVNN